MGPGKASHYGAGDNKAEAQGATLILFGVEVSERWWVFGQGSGFPLQRIPNGIIPYGCIAAYSPTKFGARIGWVDHDRIPRILSGAQGLKISSHAIDEAFRKINNPSDIF